VLQIGKGMLRVMMGDGTAGADIIPVDMAVSLIIAVAWSTAMERSVSAENITYFQYECGRGLDLCRLLH